jgi:hypothetical protein
MVLVFIFVSRYESYIIAYREWRQSANPNRSVSVVLWPHSNLIAIIKQWNDGTSSVDELRQKTAPSNLDMNCVGMLSMVAAR